ncbi:MAG TPA: tetratricopeptide repeat protein [Polyangia bacterium]|jgi:tetratricopeptide (TPR) repeat protein|nr:tetratricopeptide repeat protein [Polyangia bacterium]
MRPPIRLAPIFAVVLFIAAPTVARADDAAAAAAREHYQKATSYYDLGKYPEAIKEFEAAYEIKNDPALLYNLAQSNRLAGNAEQALHFYRTYLRYVPHPANRVEIDDRIKQLEILLQQKNATQVTPPNQTIPPGATTPPPSSEPAPTPAPPPVAPLPYAAPEQAPLPPPEAEPTPEVTKPPVAAADPARGARFETYAKYGYIASGALVAIGLIEGAVAASASSDLQNDAKAGKPYDPSIQSRGQSAQAAEAFFLIVGVLAAGGSTALYLYGNHLEHQVSAAPLASSTGVGGALRVTF